MKTDPNDLAFASIAVSPQGDIYETNGLSKREYFAIHILKGMMANPTISIRGVVEINGKDLNPISAALMGADALIAELNKEVKE